MIYKLNGKEIRIPDADIQRYMDNNDISREDAINLWLEDEDYLDNAEIDELEEKGKSVMRTIHDARKNTTKRERKPKEDPVKQNLVAYIAASLQEIRVADVQNIVITNQSKVVEFDLGEDHYKVDLIRQRKR